MAGRHCAVCTHAARAEIDALIVAGLPFRTIAARYEMSHPAVLRHRNGHMAEALAEAVASRTVESEQPAPADPEPPRPASSPRQEAAGALDVVGQLRAVNGAVLRVLSDARSSGDHRLVLLAADRVLRQLELQARLIGDLDDRVTITLAQSPEWVLVRGTLLSALRPYPDAGVAVAAALVALEGA